MLFGWFLIYLTTLLFKSNLLPINPGSCKGDLNWGSHGNDGVGRGRVDPAIPLEGDGGENGFGEADVIGNPRGNLGDNMGLCFGDRSDLEFSLCSLVV